MEGEKGVYWGRYVEQSWFWLRNSADYASHRSKLGQEFLVIPTKNFSITVPGICRHDAAQFLAVHLLPVWRQGE